MKKIFTLISAFFLLLCTTSYSQTGSTQGKKEKKFETKWKTNPFDEQVFIENKGQFDGMTKSGEKVLFASILGDVNIYFTENKIIYRYDKTSFQKPASDPNADADDPKYSKHDTYFLSAEWKGANKAVSIEARDQQSFYYSYTSAANKAIKANGFKQITYKNLYPGVDAVYQFIQGKTGIKYVLIVHPGADLSKIKIDYSGAKNISKNEQGDIIISSQLNLLTEHAPVTSYLGEAGNIAFSNVLTGNTESFKANENYNKSKTIVIDPWVTDPLFTPTDKAYDLDWDYQGNVYAYGGSPTSRLKLVKMNNAGVIQWTYTVPTNWTSSYYGDVCVDKVTGTSYVEQGFNASGAQSLKINTLGAYLATYPGTTEECEFWRANYDACNGDIVIGGGGIHGESQAAVLDTDMSVLTYTVNIMNAANPYHDVTLETIDPNGTQCYMASAHTNEDATNNNSIMQMPLPTLSPTNYNVHEQLGFKEVGSVVYTGLGETNAMNGAAASVNWLYLYNGDTLRRYHKNTGVFTTAFPIRSNTPYQYGGLAVDNCDDLFVGVDDSIYVMDSTYHIHAKIPLENDVYDISLGQGQALYACGDGFVTEIGNPITPSLISSASGTPSSCSACNGTATVNVNCGIAPYSFHWSNGNTDQTDTGMCVGIYTVTVKDGSCPARVDSSVVIINGLGGYSASVVDTNPGCPYIKGNITAYPYGGNSPYTYSWSNGETNQKDTGLVAGTYTLTVTDINGCKTFVIVTLTSTSAPTVTIAPALDSICAGASLALVASGADTYTWSPSIGLTCNNCPNPTASPSVTTTYTVIGKDSSGCQAIATATVKIKAAPKPIISGPDSVCVGGTITLNVTGGSSYEWLPSGATTSSITIVGSVTQTITVEASNGSCNHDTTMVLTVVPDPTANIAWSKDSVCSGDSLTLEGSSGLRYKWKPGNQTTANIHVAPLTTTTYTLYSYGGACVDSTTKTIPVIPVITGSIRSTVDSICPLQNATISASGIGGQATYQWAPGGQTTASITVSPSATTVYTATISGLCNTVTETYTITLVPLPVPVIIGTDWKCKGVRDTLSVSNANGPATYVWSNGKTTTSITTGAIDGDSVVSVTAYNKLGCAHDTTFNITLRSPLSIGVPAPAIFCAGSQVCIWATTSGSPNNNVTYFWSPGGATTDTICVSPSDTTDYVVTVSNGCKSSKSTVLTPNYPNLNTCCSQSITIINDTVTPSSVILGAGGNSIRYRWADSNNVVCLNPPLCDTVRVSPTVTTTYTVTGTDANGCSISQLITITLDVPCFNLTIPNVFTPTNGGTLGLDKVFGIDTRNMDGWSITIFDRWGKQMFSSTDPFKYWDGKAESGGDAPAGVYYYTITGTCQNTTYKKDGFVQLIR